MKIVSKHLHDLTKEDREQLKFLTNKPDKSFLQMVLAWKKSAPLARTSFTFMACENDKIIGWSLIILYPGHLFDGQERLDSLLSVYVKKNYRRQGVGGKLANKAKALAKLLSTDIYVRPWNKAGKLFYNKYKI